MELNEKTLKESDVFEIKKPSKTRLTNNNANFKCKMTITYYNLVMYSPFSFSFTLNLSSPFFNNNFHTFLAPDSSSKVTR